MCPADRECWKSPTDSGKPVERPFDEINTRLIGSALESEDRTFATKGKVFRSWFPTIALRFWDGVQGPSDEPDRGTSAQLRNDDSVAQELSFKWTSTPFERAGDHEAKIARNL